MVICSYLVRGVYGVLEMIPPGLGPSPTWCSLPRKEEEFYVCIYATREGDYVLFHHEGGVDVGDVDSKAQKLLVGVDEKLNLEGIKKHLLVHAPKDKKELSERDGREVAAEERGRLQLWAQSGESRVVYPCLGIHCAAPASGRKVGSKRQAPPLPVPRRDAAGGGEAGSD